MDFPIVIISICLGNSEWKGLMQIYGIFVSGFEPVHEILELIAYVFRECSDGPGHWCSLARAHIQS